MRVLTNKRIWAAANGVKMEKKDRFALYISGLSLIVSIGVFLNFKYESHQATAGEEKKNAFIAYRLGEKFAAYSVAYTHGTVGTKKEIGDFRKQIFNSIQVPQGYADSLQLRIDLTDLFSKYNKNSAFNNSMYEVLSSRVSVFHNEYISASFEAVYWAVWTIMNAMIVIENKNKNEAILVEQYMELVYPKLREVSNTLELSKDLLKEVKTIQELRKESLAFRNALKNHFVEKHTHNVRANRL
jgi:hypothetical protein